MTREVRVAHRKFPDGGVVIPSLPDLRKTANAQIERTAFIWRCVDLMCRCKQRDNGPRMELALCPSPQLHTIGAKWSGKIAWNSERLRSSLG